MALTFTESLALTQIANGDSSVEPGTPGYGAPTRAEIATYDNYANTEKTIEYNKNYLVFDVFSDESLSAIDLNKNVSLQSNQLNLTQEKNSQYVPFSLNRKADGYDLYNGVIWIVTNAGTKDNEKGAYAVAPVNVYATEDKIYFGWLIDEWITRKSGQVLFEIHVHGQVQGRDNTNIVTRGYVWKSKPGTLNVTKSNFDLDDSVESAYNESWVQEIISAAAENIAFETVREQVNYASAAADSAKQEANRASEEAIKAQNQADAAASTVSNFDSYVDERKQEIPALVETEIFSKVQEITWDQEIPAILGYDYEVTENEEGFITSINITVADYVAQELENYYTKSEIDTNVVDALEDLSDTFDTTIGELKVVNNDGAELVSTTVTGLIQEVVSNVDVTSQLNELSQEVSETYATKIEVSDKIGNLGQREDEKGNLVDIETVAEAIANVDVTSQLDELSQEISETYVPLSRLGDLGSVEENGEERPKTVEEAIEAIDISSQLTGVKTDISNLTSSVNNVQTQAGTNSEAIAELDLVVQQLQENVQNTYTYDVDYNAESGYFSFFQYTDEDTQKDDPEYPAKNSFIITGGGGGSSAGTFVKITRITPAQYVVPDGEQAIIRYSVDAQEEGEPVTELTAKWQVGGRTVKTEIIAPGEHTFDVTDYLTTTAQTVFLSITYVDSISGTIKASGTRDWKAYAVKLSIESDFDDSKPQYSGLNFPYRPYGSGEKTIHFILDGKELESKKVVSEQGQTYFIDKQNHGSHLLEIYATMEINKDTVIESNHVFKDIMWYDTTVGTPLISVANQEFTARQYESTNLEYAIYVDEDTEKAEVVLESSYIGADGEKIIEFSNSVNVTTKEKHIWTYKSTHIGEHTLTITVGDIVKTITATIVALGINAEPVSGDAFDFNPIGYSNTSINKLWSYTNENGETYSMSVSDNFDWVNGGYHLDENNDQYFCVKAGTTATIDYNLFANDPKGTGKEFKVVFRTKNIRQRDTSFLQCLDSGIGLDMKVESATVYNSLNSLTSNYCEDTIIEYEFNINKASDMRIIMAYEDGTPAIPAEYEETASFKQSSAQPIVIGSEDCDVHIYRMKAYASSLKDDEILANFIADARNPEEMISRYERNQIYTNGQLVSTSASGGFSAEALMKAAPELRYIFLEVPEFTTDKDVKIDNCTVYFRYPNGIRPEDNWTCTGVRHRGQGTSSNEYGYAGRNIDLCMDRDESMFSWTDAEGNLVESRTVTLTDNSIPTDYLNIKVNIASSENTNNAQMAQRYNLYQPFLRYARKKNSKVKDTMEFFNCVLFIRETGELENHKEFNDNNWHFYAIGNVGDSKKTDDTRVNNKKDPKEHVIEITDVDKLLSSFPKGEGEWGFGNSTYDILYSNEYVYDDEGAFESFGAETYEFRYEMKNITDEQRQENIDTWRRFYTFLVTSTDDEFKAKLKDYFVVDSALYYYLFTERYTMVDNRAKNSFWHCGKVYISNAEAAELGETEASYYIIDDEAAAINNGYRYDLTFGYDFDTSLGIDNTGNFVFPYGKEDTDRYDNNDPDSPYVFRAADSTFFCRLRDLFSEELKNMYKNREAEKAWDANPGLITQWDKCQAQFPEELWRLDYERKYYRTYCGDSIDNSIPKGVEAKFLIKMFFGRKKYARRSFELNQEIYFASKYFGTAVCSSDNNIALRCTKHDKANYSLTLVPYSDMYVCVQYGSKGNPIHIKTKAGESCTFESNLTDTDFLYVYGASHIQEMSDLSRCYLGDQNDFSKGIRLRKITIGNSSPDYNNPFLKAITFGNNPLLEYLDLTNVSGLNGALNFTACGNLKEVYAKGTNVNSVTFANGGLLETAYIPKIKSLVMKNLSHLKNFICDGYDNLETLVVEGTPALNTYEIVENAPVLKTVRLTDINWDATYQIPDGEILNRLLTIGGYSATGEELDPPATIGGYVYLLSIKQSEENKYLEAWKGDLEVRWPDGGRTEQFLVTFENRLEDGTEIVEEQWVDRQGSPLEPTKIPVKPSTIDTDFTFKGWAKPDNLSEIIDVTQEVIRSSVTYVAVYTESVRQYTVCYVMNINGIETPLIEPIVADYGTYVEYTGEIPTYTMNERNELFYWFMGWDKSGFVDGDKTITAKFDTFQYEDNAFKGLELADMRPVEIYALSRMVELRKLEYDSINNQISETEVSVGDDFALTLGHDVDYQDIESYTIIKEPVQFNGTDTIELNGSTPIYSKNELGEWEENYLSINLFDEDKDFVLALDYKMSSENINSRYDAPVMMQCLSQGLSTNGFELNCASETGAKPLISWGDESGGTATISELDRREMIVLRHKKGDPNLYVYTSNLDDFEVKNIVLKKSSATTTSATTCLVLGGAQNKNRTCYGEVFWCKIWYTDLGEQTCQKLASWPREVVNFDVSGFYRYLLVNGSGSTTFSLLASNLLDIKKPFYIKSGVSDNTIAGWSNSYLKEFLNRRVYNAIPDEFKPLIKEVVVKSTEGNRSKNISSSSSWVNLPAIYDLVSSDEFKTNSGSQNFKEHIDTYKKEVDDSLGTVAYMIGDSARVRYHSDGISDSYWTRSPVAINTYHFSISNTGSPYGYSIQTDSKGILIEISI